MPSVILRVAVPSPVRRWFDYLPPVDVAADRLRPGVRLRVPFGRGSRIGILLEVRSDSPLAPERLRPALALLDEEPVLPPAIIRLSRWAQGYYYHPPGEVLASALPALLRRGEAAGVQRTPVWRLTRAGREALQQGLVARAPRQRALLELLVEHPAGLSSDRLRTTLSAWSEPARILAARGWLEKLIPAPRRTAPTDGRPELTSDQQTAVATVRAALGTFAGFLLDGITGSGKTEVYLRLIETVLERDQQALVLVPEISLTPQLLERFERRLPGPLAVLHSALSERDRLNAWLLASAGSARVVIGTRSAVFTPLARPGLIIVDEEHDGSYKQQDGFRYHARDLAVVRARQSNIPIVLGSATPSLETLHNAAGGRYRRLSLPQRVAGAQPPTIELLDLRRQPLVEGLSPELLRRIQAHLGRREQVLLFLNRRGYAPTLICHECGWLAHCHQCDAHLTLHLRRQQLLCHHCGNEQAVPASCPGCGSVDLRPLGAGTERIEQALESEFPGVGIARIDRDNTRRRGSLQRLLNDIHSGRCQLLIGTQMLAKGHHFPEVTLVAIVDADQGLFSADFRASERLAQLILQVSGRAGRAAKPGTVIIQTHQPEHPLLNRLMGAGYAEFAAAALAEREAAGLPPYTCQALVRAEASAAEPPHRFLGEAAALGHRLSSPVELLGPVPAPMERRAGRYRAQLLLQAERRSALHSFLQRWLESVAGLKSARRVRWSLDVDPIDLF